jgi:hypothetical protein
MNSKLTYPETVDAYKRLLKQAEYKAASSVVPSTKKKYEGLVCLLELDHCATPKRLDARSEF